MIDFSNTIGFFEKGGVLMIPILACSVLALAIFGERLIRFACTGRRGAGLAERVAGLWKSGKRQDARRIAVESNSPMGRVLARAMEVKEGNQEMLKVVINNAIDDEVRSLSRYTQALATIGNIAPMLGLLGTVMGMIEAFMVIQQMGGKVNAVVLAGGIWEAMLTTAFGLFVAIPTTAAHSYLFARIRKYEEELENGSVVFMKEMTAGTIEDEAHCHVLAGEIGAK